jgi:hypothetical protein
MHILHINIKREHDCNEPYKKNLDNVMITDPLVPYSKSEIRRPGAETCIASIAWIQSLHLE